MSTKPSILNKGKRRSVKRKKEKNAYPIILIIVVGLVSGIVGYFVRNLDVFSISPPDVITRNNTMHITTNTTINNGPSMKMNFNLGEFQMYPVLKFGALNVTDGLVYMNEPAYHIPTHDKIRYIQYFNFTQDQNISGIYLYYYGVDGQGLNAKVLDENNTEISNLDIDSSGFNYNGQAINILSNSIYLYSNKVYKFVLGSTIDRTMDSFITLCSYYYYKDSNIAFPNRISDGLTLDSWVLSNSTKYGCIISWDGINNTIPDIFMCFVNTSVVDIHPVVEEQYYYSFGGLFVNMTTLDSLLAGFIDIDFSRINFSLICTDVNVNVEPDYKKYLIGNEEFNIVDGTYTISKIFDKSEGSFEMYWRAESSSLYNITMASCEFQIEFL